MNGNPLCSHVTTDLSSERAGAGVEVSSPEGTTSNDRLLDILTSQTKLNKFVSILQ